MANGIETPTRQATSPDEPPAPPAESLSARELVLLLTCLVLASVVYFTLSSHAAAGSLMRTTSASIVPVAAAVPAAGAAPATAAAPGAVPAPDRIAALESALAAREAESAALAQQLATGSSAVDSASSLIDRGIPFGQVWERWDAPHGASHKSWLVQSARLVVAERRVVVKSDADRPLSLPVRDGDTSAFLFEAADPPACTSWLATGFLATSPFAMDWNNYWHFNVDDFFLMLHVIMNEHAHGTGGPRAPPSVFLAVPFGHRESGNIVVPYSLTENVTRFMCVKIQCARTIFRMSALTSPVPPPLQQRRGARLFRWVRAR